MGRLLPLPSVPAGRALGVFPSGEVPPPSPSAGGHSAAAGAREPPAFPLAPLGGIPPCSNTSTSSSSSAEVLTEESVSSTQSGDDYKPSSSEDEGSYSSGLEKGHLDLASRRTKVGEAQDLKANQNKKVKCRICQVELSYTNKSTSTLLRHYRAKHENEIPDTPRITPASRKQLLDQALLNFIVKDSQALSIVESEGFKELIQVLEPSYVLLTRKTIKKMVADKHKEEREKVKMEIQQAVAVSITTDMWTSVNMEAYLALTCHYMNANMQLCSSVLGVQYFPQNHTADNLAQVKRGMMENCAITNKVKCLE